MTFAVTSAELLRGLLPLDVESYLRARGWQRVAVQERFSVWANLVRGQAAEVLVPQSEMLADYPRRIAELLDELEAVEGIPQAQAFEDISSVAFDVYRFRVETAGGRRSGSLPLVQGADFVAAARDMLFAAACSTVRKRAIFSSRRPPPAVDLLEQALLDQTERGSYVVKAKVPIPPIPDGPQAELFPIGRPSVPFERRVGLTLLSAIDGLNHAAREAAATGSLEPFEEAVSVGVSANLCQAIVETQTHANASTALAVSLTWSPTLPTGAVEQTVVVSTEVIPFVARAIEHLRARAVEESVTITGNVFRLQRDAPDLGSPGVIGIAGWIEGFPKPVRMRVELGPLSYAEAIRAHLEGNLVRVEGELERHGTRMVLAQARDLTVIEAAGADKPLLE